MPNLVESSLRRLQHQIGYNHASDEAVQKRVRMEARHIHRHLKTDFLNYLKNITLMQTVTCKRLLMEAGAARSKFREIHRVDGAHGLLFAAFGDGFNFFVAGPELVEVFQFGDSAGTNYAEADPNCISVVPNRFWKLRVLNFPIWVR